MYTNYRCKLKNTPVDVQISRIFNEQSAELDVHLVQRCLDYTPFEQSVVHQTCGQLVKLEKWPDATGADIVVNDFMNIIGMQLKENDRCRSPCEDRLEKAEKRVLLEDEDENIEGSTIVLSENEVNEYPSWDSQIRGIELTAPELMLVENDDSAIELMKELEQVWLVWNSELKTNFRSQRTRELIVGRHLYFDKKPTWLSDESYVQSTQNISNTLLIHRIISNHFWSQVAPQLIYAWCDMMQEQEQMLIEDLAHRMENFLRGALKISKFEWTLQICEILLLNKECWIDVLLDDAQKDQFFNSIASLQAFLLRDIVYANIDVELADAEVGSYTAWDIVKRLVEIGTDVVRVECRLYPLMYPEQRTFSIASSLILEKFDIQNVEPFKLVTEELHSIKNAMETEENENRVDYAIEMHKKLIGLENQTKMICTIWFSEPYEFDFTNVKSQLLNSMRECRKVLHNDITSYIYGRIKIIVDYYTISSQKLYGKDQFSQMYNLVGIRDVDFPKIKEMVNNLHAEFWRLAEQFDFTEVTMQKYYQASRTLFRLGYLADLVWQKLLVDRTRIERIVRYLLNDRSTAMHYEGALLEDTLKMNIKKYRNCHTFSDLKMIANRFQELASRAAKLRHDHPILDAQLQLFNLEVVNVNSESLIKRVNILADVSTVHKMIVSFEETFMNSRVSDVDCGEANAEVANLNHKFNHINQEIAEQTHIDEALKDSLDLLFAKIAKILDASNKVLPVVNALCSEGMKLRHWDKILSGMNLNENAKDELLVKDLLKMELVDEAEKCEEVSNLANKEMILEEALDAMKQQWNEVTVEYVRNPTTGIPEMDVKNEIVVFIEEQIIKTQMNISSPFATAMLPVLKDWLQRLQRLQSTVDTYRKCISKWTYLEPLFGAEDIAYQMPEEWRIFQEVSTKWRSLNEKMCKISKFFDLSEVNYTKEFTDILETFQRIQRGFDSYLQKRKLNYPRLYFLSNNELLEMLSRSRNPEHIQPYLFKMFSSIYSMECKNRSEITAVFSENGEKFKLSKAININHFKRHVDKWLAELERQIKQTVKAKLKNMMRLCGTELPSIYDLVGEHGAQTVLLHCRLVYTQKIEDAIVNSKLTDVDNEFEAYINKLQKHQPDTNEEQLIIENLLIEISDQRQILNRLISVNCKSVHSYEWTSQLRYYWSNDNLFIRVYNLNVLYGYEYSSIQAPFVMTPIIRKVHRELMTFQSQGYAGMLKGPAATGKSESVKELAKILGNFFVVFNCSPQVDRLQLEDLICGTVLSGTTLCLDEFNRLSEEDMAWFASHMLGIYQAQLSGNAKYRIRNLQLNVSKTASFYLTINPKFLARSSLPANIYSIVRGISMDVADIKSIASAYLLLAGFKQAQKTTTMIVNVFEQCQALLSPMHHYDFHLRTALATVTEAVALKTGTSDELEIVGRAIRYVLTPYIVNSDISAFDRIVVSAIPQSKKNDFDEVTKKIIIKTIEEMNLVPNEKFVDACFKIFHLSRHRQAFILLGRSLTGKSTAIKVVKRVLKLCASINCRVFKFNPSQMDSDFLYGHYDGTRLDWVPGLLAQKLVVKLEDEEEGWLILDGVIDSIWVESMNSLFDSNKKVNKMNLDLCLSNGETVPLKSNIRILFECDTLERVAPSTVSRCQVVYFDDELNPLSTWNKFLPSSSLNQISELLESPIMDKLLLKKVFLERTSRFFEIYKNYDTQDKNLCNFVLFNSTATICDPERHVKWMNRHEIKAETMYSSFPTIIGQWTSFEQYEGEELRSYFTKSLIKQLVQFSNFMVTIYGHHGRGRIKFLEEIVKTFEPDRWEVHLLDLSAEMQTRDLLSTILSCNLIRMHSNHYTGQGEKSILIVLKGLEQLKHSSSNSTYEFFRSFYDFGRVLTSNGESIRFSGVHFLADFTTDVKSPHRLTVPDRFKRFIFPFYFEETESAPNYLCDSYINQFKPEQPIESKETNTQRSLFKETNVVVDEFRNDIIGELQAACHDMQPEIYPLCCKYVKYVKSFGLNEEIEKGHALLPSYVIHLSEDEKPTAFEGHSLEKKLREIISQKGNIEPEKVNLHEYLIRKFAFLHKAVTMPCDGHCIMIGEAENRAADICEMVANATGCFYETALTQITEIYWRETIIKTENGFGQILSDLCVIMNNGGLPLRLFGQQQTLVARSGAGETFDNRGTANTAAQSMEWTQRISVSHKLRTQLHIVLSMSRRSVMEYNAQFYQLFHYALVVNMDNWMRDDMISFLHNNSIIFCVEDIMNVHDVMMELSNRYDHSDFISFVQTYCHMVKRKKHQIETMEARYKTGIQKLNKADEQMNFLQEELIRLQPELVRTSLETTVLMSTIERETIEIENAREVVAANEFKANETATKAQALKVECQQELAEALPALESAVEALEILNQRDISTLKTMRNPPQAVRICLEAVCILLGEQPARVKDTGRSGKAKYDYWPTALKMLSDIHFLSRIRSFQKRQIVELSSRNYIPKPEFNPEYIRAVSKDVTSLAATGLCLWVRAIDTYERISKIVEPKKQKLKKAEMMVKHNMKQLEARRKALQDVTERLQGLSDKFSQMSQKKQDLQNQIQACETKVNRAIRLLSALGSERSRWESNIEHLQKETGTYRRTVLIGAAIIAYLGNVEYGFRKLAVSRILQNCALSEGFSMRSILDHTSILCAEKKEKTIETYVIIDYAQKVPFIIDPHGESNRMLPRLLGDKMVVLDLIQRDILDDVVAAVNDGKTLILDNVSEPLPLFVIQLLKPKLIVDKESGEKSEWKRIDHIQIEHHFCHYHKDFRLYFRSDRMERGFGVEFFKNFKVCVVNISLGQSVIEENVMDLFLDVNVTELNSKRDELSTERAKCLIQLDQLEEKILDVLGKSKDLDNDRVVEMLGGIRELSSACDARTLELNAVEEQLSRHRLRYVELSKFTARLIFMSMSLSKLSPFYLRNLRFYFDIFKEAVSGEQKLFKENKIEPLKQKVLHAFRHKIMNSLFSEHRSIFDFVTQNSISYNDIKRMTDKDFLQKFSKHVEPTDLNLRDIVFSADSRIPIAMLLNSQSTYVIRNIYTFSEQMPRDPPVNPLDPMHNQNRIHLIPTDSIANFDWKYCLEDDQWFIIQNCQLLNNDQLAQLESLIDQIANCESRKENFRMFVIIYPESGEARHSLLGRCQVVTVDDNYSLKGFLIYCYSTISPMTLHEKLETVKSNEENNNQLLQAGRKELLYRLCCFHYCLVERSKYGFFGWTGSFRVSTVNLDSAVNLFKDLCDRWSEINFNLLRSNVLEVAYLSDVASEHDLKVFHVLAQWIFVGLNKYDNHIIDTMYLKSYNVTVEKMIEQIKTTNLPKDIVLSGLNEKVARSFKCRKTLDVKETIKNLLKNNNEVETTQVLEVPTIEDLQISLSEDVNSTSHEGINHCIENEVHALEGTRLFPKRLQYLKSLLASGLPIRRVELQHLDRPQAILEQLKQIYSKKHRITVDELSCYGTLKLPNASAESVEFAGCYICCGSYNPDYNCLQEAERSFEVVETVWILVRRKQNVNVRPDSISVPLYHENASRQFVHLINVELDTNLPETHWLLRGVKMSSVRPFNLDPSLI
ncbi:Dynein heavy chain at 62B [Aphelenchoides besseyi]|nr:Dynein heavy chain at 62B [Aphelenchoides besseyi]